MSHHDNLPQQRTKKEPFSIYFYLEHLDIIQKVLFHPTTTSHIVSRALVINSNNKKKKNRSLPQDLTERAFFFGGGGEFSDYFSVCLHESIRERFESER